MFAKVLRPVMKVTLICFAKNGIEGFALTAANVNTAHGKSYNELQSLKLIVGISCCS